MSQDLCFVIIYHVMKDISTHHSVALDMCNDTRKRVEGYVDSYDTRPPRSCVVEIVKT